MAQAARKTKEAGVQAAAAHKAVEQAKAQAQGVSGREDKVKASEASVPAKEAGLKEERKRVEIVQRVLEVREAKVAPRVANEGASTGGHESIGATER